MAHRLMVQGRVDLEALSPRDANAQRMPPAVDLKPKAAQLKTAKEKDHPPPPPPQVFEPPSSDYPDGAVYQVGKLLGKGGFAICHQGQHQTTRQRVALKIVKSQMPTRMEQKFQTELQIHSKMKHKNIVHFFRAFTFDICTYLVLEICPNGSLMDMVKRRKGLTEPEVRFYTVQVAGAIKYMHGKGIIHRDLKMGNIFLDARMNAKIGDFGLAALVVTGRDMQTIRRTTLCGTPNYIAPEILEKGKKGHDHMVDIWSLGIIMFAMLTSKPPFQSSTTDEIYRRARERDYEWPTTESSQKFISDAAKDLVAVMLQDAQSRPDPDEIVQHRFFTSGYMPLTSEMTPRLRELPPEKEEFYRQDLGTRLLKASVANFEDLCRDCMVGPWAEPQRSHTKVWKEMAAEEKACLTPKIPLAENVVYRPFDEWLEEQRTLEQNHRQLRVQQHQQHAAPRDTGVPPSSVSQGSSATDELATSTARPPTGLLRAPPQSFAAQQRAQNRPATSLHASGRGQTEAVTTSEASSRKDTRMRRIETTGVRVAERVQHYEQIPSSKPSLRAPASTAMGTKGEATSRPPTMVSDQIAIKMPYRDGRKTSLFSPEERPEEVPDTKPDLILERLRRLQAELERALNARTMAIITSKTVTPPHPHVVVKWVDYTNKFGLGYILNDGSVGCILRSISTGEGSSAATLPPACMLIHGAETHIQKRQDPRYADRHQPVPMKERIHFYENNGEAGLCHLAVSPDLFRVSIGEDGVPGKMGPGKDSYQHRKRERIILWKKFANYMIAYGRDEVAPAEESAAADKPAVPAELVTFYQRFGDVGCWVFCDGHLQFNFPDHTKLVLDSTGTWCHFWHLPLDAASRLATTGSLGEAALDERGMLSYPLQTLLNFQTKATASRPGRTVSSSRRRPEIEPELQGIPAANDFRRKIEFIKNVVKEWAANGGLGNSAMGKESRLRWTGFRETVNVETPQKHVWVTVGARGGDQRLTSYVDPRRPNEIGEDVEEPTRKASR